ncbi:MAG: CDP-diacylglycerol--glycerol-3-phosphate 3-phosphatidyltransferase [Coriobacteriales bacterium]
MSDDTARIWTPANIVTLMRILLIPVFVAALLSPWPSWLPEPEFWAAWQPWIAAAVFIIISATDAIDGHLARSRDEITDLGKFLDPLADKILVCAALLALVELQAFPSWVALIIIAREFIVSGLRMVAAAQGTVIAASMYGKFKTVLQICAILLFTVKDSLQITLMGDGFAMCFTIFSWLVLLAAVVMTIVSMVDYFYKSREVLGFGKRSAR